MQSQDAIIFAVWLPSMENVNFLHEWLKNIVDGNFADCDIFIGINPSPYQDHAYEICWSYRKYFANMVVSHVNPDLHVNSDVSGYQKALELMINFRPDSPYRLVWFGHTRGMSHNNVSPYDYDKGYISKNFFNKREYVTKKMLNDVKAGSWAPFISLHEFPLGKHFSSFYDFEYPELPLFHMFTFFVFRGEPLYKFLSYCKCKTYNQKTFYATNLGTYSQAGRWLFEFASGQIIWQQGYYPLYEQCIGLALEDSIKPTPEIVKILIEHHQQKIGKQESLDKLRLEHPELIKKLSYEELICAFPNLKKK